MSSIIIEGIIFSKSFLAKTLGLIGKKKPFPLYLETHFGIHTFFLKFPIDIIILDEKNIVVVKMENLKPFRLFFWNPKYKKVLELPSGTIKLKRVKLKDTILLQ
jgi:uncharacterized protein